MAPPNEDIPDTPDTRHPLKKQFDRARKRYEARIQEGRERGLSSEEKLLGAIFGTTPNTEAMPGESPVDRSSLRRAARANLVGLCFSGGGIRSATFNLGVLHALAHLNVLRHVDYLSTVSGGGYIASWLYAWSSRTPGGVNRVQAALDPFRSPLPYDDRVRPIRFLREYSNYLTPRLGLFGADTWTMIAVWLRNGLLNQLVLLTFFSAVLIAPRALGWVPGTNAPLLMILAVFLFAVGCFGIGRALSVLNMPAATGTRMGRGPGQGAVQARVVLPIFMAAVAFASLSARALARAEASPRFLALVALIGLAAGLAVIQVVGGYGRCFASTRTSRGADVANALGVALAALVAALAGAAIVWALSHWLGSALRPLGRPSNRWQWDAVTWGTPLLVQTFAFVGVINIGMLGRGFPDERREWASRLGAWLTIYALVWTVWFAAAIYAPFWLGLLGARRASLGATTWIVSTVAGVLSGKSDKTGPVNAKALSGQVLGWIASASLVVFIIGLLVAHAMAVHVFLARVAYHGQPSLTLTWIRERYWTYLQPDHWASALLLALVCLSTAFILAQRIDINEFSMHHFYKNRLVRCYLGASRAATRTPNPFTGFDAHDDVKLASLRQYRPATPAQGADPQHRYVGPYPIVNVALNLVKGDNLAWQERKAESFVFTPYYSGFTNLAARDTGSQHNVATHAYRPTLLFGYEHEQGIALGTAVAISGAAANPNMGYQSSPAGGFLMTVFNARLGWWLGNPRRDWKWRRSSPGNGLLYLLAELFGSTNDRSAFVNLSDGGHFENLGLYELVRRRCRYIVCGDAEQDRAVTFAGLGNAIRKCRIDLGTEISIDLRTIRPAKSGFSRFHYAVGTIVYPAGPQGRLIYLKSSLRSDDPADVLEYRSRHHEFPHETTADQWFTESQFESYRTLGFQVAMSAFLEPALQGPLMSRSDLDRFFADVETRWRQAQA